MTRTSRMRYIGAMLCVAIIISGCQSSGRRWTTAWKQRTKPKTNFQGVDGPQEEVTYWPNKPGKAGSRSSDMASSSKDKFPRKADQSRQVADLMAEGDQLRKSGKFDEARLRYSKALSMSPDNADLHHRLAITADQMQQYAMADDHYQAALRLRPRDAKLLNDMGYSAYLRGNTQQAENILREALSIDRNHRVAMANLGMIYAQQNRYQEAEEMFRNGMPESETQQSLAQLFSSNQSMASTDQGFANSGVPTSNGSRNRDMSKMTQSEVQAEMARIKQDAILNRRREDQQRMLQDRNQTVDEEMYQQQQVAQQMPYNRRFASNEPVIIGSNATGGSGNYQGQQNSMAGSTSDRQGMNTYANVNQNSMMAPNGNVPQSGGNANAMNGMANDRSFGSGASDQTAAAPPQIKIFRGSNSTTQQVRATNDSQRQQGWDQRGSAASSNFAQQSNGYNNACQIATQLGMSAGPGSMFPVMQGPPESEINPAVNTAGQRNNRFGIELQQSLDPQYSQNTGSNAIEQMSNRSSPNPDGDSYLPSIAPMSPANNWASPGVSPLNWQNDSRASSDWSTETTPTNVPQINTNGQYNMRRVITSEGTQPGQSMSPGQNTMNPRSTGQPARPYEGAWPNTNSLPQRQNPSVYLGTNDELSGYNNGTQTQRRNPSVYQGTNDELDTYNNGSQTQRRNPNLQMNGRSPETLEMMGINPNSQYGGSAPSGSNGGSGSSSDQSGNSLPMYPFAPNR